MIYKIDIRLGLAVNIVNESTISQAGSTNASKDCSEIQNNHQQRLYSMVDLFAGCGGLSLGFEKAGFTSVFMNELNEDAKATYLMNRHHLLGGMKFSENKALHSNDAHELKGKRLDQLVSDLSQISDVGLQFDKVSKTSGGGEQLRYFDWRSALPRFLGYRYSEILFS